MFMHFLMRSIIHFWPCSPTVDNTKVKIIKIQTKSKPSVANPKVKNADKVIVKLTINQKQLKDLWRLVFTPPSIWSLSSACLISHKMSDALRKSENDESRHKWNMKHTWGLDCMSTLSTVYWTADHLRSLTRWTDRISSNVFVMLAVNQIISTCYQFEMCNM